MHIAIIGTRGIPNNYGGFEQCAEFLAAGLVKKGFDVTVYNSHNHPYQHKEWNGVNLIHRFDPENKLGTAGQFIYDLNCILDSRKRSFDIILQLGYTSSSVWGRFLPRKKSIVTTNMDGLEWKRSKYSKPVQQFLQYAEKLGVKFSDHLISDSIGIQQYLKTKYKQDSVFIPYGANLFTSPNPQILEEYNIKEFDYNLLIARLEPENSIETILDGVVLSTSKMPFLIIGNYNTKYGDYLRNKFKSSSNIKFLGGIYNLDKLNNLRFFSALYFHGHTVGGTNPSLLEAMASNALICAHDNIFNKSILESDAFYFNTYKDVANLVSNITSVNKLSSGNQRKLANNTNKIKNTYSWSIIIDQYMAHFERIISFKSNLVTVKPFSQTA